MKIFQFLYNLFFPLGLIIILPQYLPRMWKRGGYQDQFLQRLGIFNETVINRIGTGRIWVHAVSVGEILIALKFIRRWKEKYPEARFLLSTTTTTALSIANKETSDWLEPIANPIDFFWITNKLIDSFQPAALIMIEGDIWPQRLFYCKKKKIPTALITARLSPRSESRMKRFRWMIRPFFNLLDLITLPSAKDEARWLALGIDASRLCITGNMKYDQQGIPIVQPPRDLDVIFSNLGWKKKDRIFLAGSTYNLEEEKILMKAWLELRKKFSDLRFVIAPRYVERRQELMDLFKKYNISVALRSQASEKKADVLTRIFHPSLLRKPGSPMAAPLDLNFDQDSMDSYSPDKNPVSALPHQPSRLSCHESDEISGLILDTTGELNSWYSIATFVFVGKSLGVGGAHGGHNPVEPLVLKKPVLVGPSMENFEPLISELLQAQGVIEVHNENDIIQSAKNFLLHPEEAIESVERGLQTLSKHQGSIERTCDLLSLII